MITKYADLEWEDGTPVDNPRFEEGYLYIPTARNKVCAGSKVGKDRPAGYYNYSDGGFAGSENFFQKVRERPRGPESYEEFFL